MYGIYFNISTRTDLQNFPQTVYFILKVLVYKFVPFINLLSIEIFYGANPLYGGNIAFPQIIKLLKFRFRYKYEKLTVGDTIKNVEYRNLKVNWQ